MASVRRSIDKPMMNRTAAVSNNADLERDLGYEYRRIMGRKWRELREARGLTQQEVADHLGLGHTAISAMEHGRSVLAPERYADLADLFKVPDVDMGKFLLRYTNPWIYGMIFGRREQSLRHDLGLLPDRIGEREPKDAH